MDLTDALLRLFGAVRDLNGHARGFALLLALPVLALAVADWRVRRTR